MKHTHSFMRAMSATRQHNPAEYEVLRWNADAATWEAAVLNIDAIHEQGLIDVAKRDNARVSRREGQHFFHIIASQAN